MRRGSRGNVNIIDFSSIAELEALWAGARETGIEGLMLKRRGSPISPASRRAIGISGSAPLHVDAVLMYAQRGSGKRSSYYSDYTFGAWRNGRKALLSWCRSAKSYFRLHRRELRQLDSSTVHGG
ncbi:MAG: hypothetical protein R3D30_11480 [Hyphomicrobiales bacterium]